MFTKDKALPSFAYWSISNYEASFINSLLKHLKAMNLLFGYCIDLVVFVFFKHERQSMQLKQEQQSLLGFCLGSSSKVSKKLINSLYFSFSR